MPRNRGEKPESGAPTWPKLLLVDADPGADELDIGSARSLESFGHVLPVPHVPHGVEELGLSVLILEVEGVLPGVEHEQGSARLRQVRLVVVDLRHEELLPER